MRDAITRARNGERSVMLQLLLYDVKQRLWHGSIEAAFRDWYLSFRQAAACPSGL